MAYHPPFIGEDCTEVVADNILDVKIYNIKFFLHPLFSIEHVFAENLRNIFKEYIEYESRNTLEDLKNNLLKLRSKKDQTNFDQIDHDELIIEIKNARELFFEKAVKYREIVNSILNTWKHIKRVREIQTFVNTTVQLFIKKDNVDAKEEQQWRKSFFDDTVSELLDEYKFECKKRRRDGDEDEDKGRTNQESDDNNPEESSIRLTVRRDKLKHGLAKIFQKMFGQPGEPRVIFSLADTANVSKKVTEPKEIQRRSAVDSFNIFLRIVCNGIEVCKTKSFALSHDFVVDVNQSLSIQFTEVPKYLTIEVYETAKRIQKNKLFVLNLPIRVDSSKKMADYTFEKRSAIRYKHAGVGSGMDLKSVAESLNIKVSNKENVFLKIKGVLYYQMVWDRKQIFQPTVVQWQQSELSRVVDQNYCIDYEKLQTTIETNKKTIGEDVFNALKDVLPEDSSNYFR